MKEITLLFHMYSELYVPLQQYAGLKEPSGMTMLDFPICFP